MHHCTTMYNMLMIIYIYIHIYICIYLIISVELEGAVRRNAARRLDVRWSSCRFRVNPRKVPGRAAGAAATHGTAMDTDRDGPG